MFGYLRPFKPELKVKDYSIYKAVYCGLCNTLGKRYGLLSRMILSYDATLMCILAMSLADGCMGFERKRCPVKPFKNCDAARKNPAIEYWADVSVILWYYKLLDNYNDGSLINKAAMLPLLWKFKISFRKAIKRNEFAAECSKKYIEAQSEVEKKEKRMIDEAAQPTAELLSKLLSRCAVSETEHRILSRMGYFIGRWIYIADAADDYKKDLESGGYNPFADMEHDLAMKSAEQLLNQCVSEIMLSASLLDVKRFGDIIDNIISLGMPEMKNAVLSGLGKKKRAQQFAAIYRI